MRRRFTTALGLSARPAGRTSLGDYGTHTTTVMPAEVPFNRLTTFPGKGTTKRTVWEASPTMAGTGQRNSEVFIGQRSEARARSAPAALDDYYTRWNRGEV